MTSRSLGYAILCNLLQNPRQTAALLLQQLKLTGNEARHELDEELTRLGDQFFIEQDSKKRLDISLDGFWFLMQQILLQNYPVPEWMNRNFFHGNGQLINLAARLTSKGGRGYSSQVHVEDYYHHLHSPYILPLLPHLSSQWQLALISAWSHFEYSVGHVIWQWPALSLQAQQTPFAADVRKRLAYIEWENPLLLNDEEHPDNSAGWHELIALIRDESSEQQDLYTQLENTLSDWQKRNKSRGYPDGIMIVIWLGLLIQLDHTRALNWLEKVTKNLKKNHSLQAQPLSRILSGISQEYLRDHFKLQLESPDSIDLNWLNIWSTLCAIAIRGPHNPLLKQLRDIDCSRLLAMAPENLLMELSQDLLMFMLQLGNTSLPLFSRIKQPEPWEHWLTMLAGQGSATQQERLIWILSPNLGYLTCKLQKLTDKENWSQGRQIETRRILELGDDVLTQADREIHAQLQSPYPTFGKLPNRLLERLAKHELLFNPEGEPLQLLLTSPLLTIESAPTGIICTLDPEIKPHQQLEVTHLASDLWQLTMLPPTLANLLPKLQEIPELPPAALPELQKRLDQIPKLLWHSSHPGLKGNVALTPWPGEPTLHLNWQDNLLQLSLVSECNTASHLPRLPLGEGSSLLRDWSQHHHFWKRDLEAEVRQAKKLRKTLGSTTRNNQWQLQGPELLAFMQRLPDLLEEHQIRASWHETSRRVTLLGESDLELRIAKQQNWFEVSGELKLDKLQVVDLRLLLRQIQPGSRSIQLDDKSSLLLSEKLAKRLTTLAAMLDEEQKISAQLAYPLSRLLESITTQGDAGWEQLQNEWEQEVRLPANLLTPLRDYQKEGANWLATLAQHGFGACLADDMGLGKTLQALTLLRHRQEKGPALVIVPKSLVLNWQEEASRFAPELNIIALDQHDNRQEALTALKAGDVVLLNYGLLGSLQEPLQAHHWSTLIADEAQQIKNATTQRAKILFTLPADFRLALSGTPVENHLGELWSLFNFINPGLLGNHTHFKQRFGKAARDENHMEQLRGVITPFVLRRLKRQVLTELPEKTEIVHHISLSDEERALYEASRLEALQQMQQAEGHALMQLLSSLTRLRRLCCSPALLLADWKKSQSKLDAAMELIVDAIDNGHRLLVFSQFVDLLSLLRKRLEKAKLEYCYLDGSCSSKQRQEAVSRFQQTLVPLFLISLKAGGTGLNLTQADTVIHLDPWWNPAVEDQASDRAHRMGQTEPVTVYRLVCKGTVEEKIVALHAEKRALADGLLSDQGETVGINAEMIRDLLG